jgi:hypothetical protein
MRAGRALARRYRPRPAGQEWRAPAWRVFGGMMSSMIGTADRRRDIATHQNVTFYVLPNLIEWL